MKQGTIFKCIKTISNNSKGRKMEYTSREEWATQFNRNVDRFDELQKIYVKLLMIESDVEYDLEILKDNKMSKDKKTYARDSKYIKTKLKRIQIETTFFKREKNEVKDKLKVLQRFRFR